MPKTQEQKDKENDFKVTPKLEDTVNVHLEEYLDTIGEGTGEVGPPPKRKKVVEIDKDDIEEDTEDLGEDNDLEEEDDGIENGDDDVEEEEETDGDKDGSQKEEVVVLPDSHYRAAVHQGFSAEEITGMLDSNPEAALKFFEKVHASTNYITKQTSALGRKHQELEKKMLGEEKLDENAYKPVVDIEKYEAEYGESAPAQVAIMKAMVEQGRQQHEEMQAIKQQQQPVTQQDNSEQERIWNEVRAFFSDKDIQKHYAKEYGVDTGDGRWDEILTGRQFNNRTALIQEADAYIAGSKIQGNDVTYTEALGRAHIAANKDSMAAIAREDLKAKVKKRSRGITVKNSGKVVVKKPTKESKQKDLHDKTRMRLKKYLGVNAE